jgi:hypothetical protein
VDPEAIGDISETLKGALWERLQAVPGFANINQIRIDSPDNVNIGNAPQLALFLYRVVDDGHTRNRDPRPDPVAGIVRYPPLSLRLHYLITPFVQSTVDEHRLLGVVMLALHDVGSLTGPILQGTLAGEDLELHVNHDDLNTEELTRLWSSFSKQYRLSVGYSIRPVRIASLRQRSSTRISEIQDQYQQV